MGRAATVAVGGLLAQAVTASSKQAVRPEPGIGQPGRFRRILVFL